MIITNIIIRRRFNGETNGRRAWHHRDARMRGDGRKGGQVSDQLEKGFSRDLYLEPHLPQIRNRRRKGNDKALGLAGACTGGNDEIPPLV